MKYNDWYWREAVVSLVLLAGPGLVGAQEKQTTSSMLEQSGLATKYPGDAGIASDPRVIFAENFETGNVAEIAARWTEVKNPGSQVWLPATTSRRGVEANDRCR
jgi:hypothetical protein